MVCVTESSLEAYWIQLIYRVSSGMFAPTTYFS